MKTEQLLIAHCHIIKEVMELSISNINVYYNRIIWLFVQNLLVISNTKQNKTSDFLNRQKKLL